MCYASSLPLPAAVDRDDSPQTKFPEELSKLKKLGAEAKEWLTQYPYRWTPLHEKSEEHHEEMSDFKLILVSAQSSIFHSD
jgi:hypothetical protein